MKDTELKPCPFCGSKNIVLTSHGAVIVFVQCDDCCATFPHFDSEEEAINTWNRRVHNEQGRDRGNGE